MLDPYKTTKIKIKDIKSEAPEIKLFTLEFTDNKERENFNPMPGQIVEIGVPGFGEGPFAVCSCWFERKYFQICVRKAGRLTNKLHSLMVGDEITLRGPYGLGIFPETDRNLLLIAGGMGLAPLRPLIQRYANLREKENESARMKKKGAVTENEMSICRDALRCVSTTGEHKKEKQRVQLFYGVKSQKDMIFKSEYKEWKKYIDMHVTLDKAEKGWAGHAGLITTLFKDVKIIENPLAILCGPPVMFKFILEELRKFNFKDEDIYMSLERRIHCGIGLCQHCAVGSKYICKDGPVFRWADVKNIKGII
ncbi:MAG: FAD/NAD(P)-binding protein [bacterium]